MKKYLIALLLFIGTYGSGIVLFKLIEPYLLKELAAIVYKTVVAAIFLFFIIRYTQKSNLFSLTKLSKQQIYLVAGLLLLFVLNNYWLATNSTSTGFMKSSNLYLVILGFIVNSFFEEFIYRGFLQRYINQQSTVLKQPLTQGNIFASCLMFCAHFGFFTVMDFALAISSLTLVLIFSLVVGYIQDKNGSIWWAILIHTLANLIHLIININNY